MRYSDEMWLGEDIARNLGQERYRNKYNTIKVLSQVDLNRKFKASELGLNGSSVSKLSDVVKVVGHEEMFIQTCGDNYKKVLVNIYQINPTFNFDDFNKGVQRTIKEVLADREYDLRNLQLTIDLMKSII